MSENSINKKQLIFLIATAGIGLLSWGVFGVYFSRTQAKYDRFPEIEREEDQKTRTFLYADKNNDHILDQEELIELGKELEVITKSPQPISQLEARIMNSPEEVYKKYNETKREEYRNYLNSIPAF